ncbi:hypothetical protein [Methylobacterium sp. WL120]|uniref:hypothetical protein n=1 Tax=Methylobacterium sp. WL120 TaxID=2603887 RepID=UPI001FEE2686|nr:hypothetical protein [Methylobacterium sp. WL120]
MRVVDQGAEEIAEALGSLDVDWMDATAGNVIAKLTAFGVKEAYGRADVAALLDDHFDEGLLCCRLFLGLSKDQSEALLREALGKGGIGVTRNQTDRAAFLVALEGFGLLDAMATTVNRKLVWSDVLVERLRSGRASAISGQKRGRGLEDFAEAIVREVFGEGAYELRCTFTGVGGKIAKCDIAIPAGPVRSSSSRPRPTARPVRS